MKLDAGIPRVALVAAAVSLLSACQEKLDTSRTSASLETLGEDIHYTACRRFASEAYPEDVQGVQTRALCRGEEAAPADDPSQPLAIRALNALAGNRARLVPALDSSIPEPTHDPLRQLLVDILPLYEAPTELIPAQTRALGAQMDALANDASITAILGRFSARQGYRPARFDLGLARPSLAYSEMPTVIDQVFGAIAPSGYARDSFEQLLSVSSLELATAANDTLDPWQTTSTLTLARTMLLRTAADASVALPTFSSGVPRYAIRRDVRGMVLPSPAGAVPAPFADVNPADGLADVDATGHFVDAAGAVLAVPPPFRTNGEDPSVSRDASGRALRADNSLYYQYVDADSTLLGALVREAPGLLDQTNPALLDAAYGISVMLGTSSTRAETYGATSLTFTGPDPATGPLFDAVHATAQVLPRPQTVDMLSTLGGILVAKEGPIAGLVGAVLDADALADAHPEAVIAHQPNILWDEVLVPVEAIARGNANGASQRPLDALMRVLNATVPGSSGLTVAEAMTGILPLYARMRDTVTFDTTDISDPAALGSTSTINNPVPTTPLTTPVDRGAPNAASNESLLQRSLHLIADLNGAVLCNKEGAKIELFPGIYFQPQPQNRTASDAFAFKECTMVRISNVGQAFAQAALGRYDIEFVDQGLTTMVANSRGTVDALLEGRSGIDGFTTMPTAEAMARFTFAPRNSWLQAQFNDPLTKDGVPIEDRHCIGRAAGNRSAACPSAVIFAWEKLINLQDPTQSCSTPSATCASFLSALRPLLGALDDADSGTTFLFGDLSEALHRHWAAPGAARTQSANRTAANFSFQDDVRSYEPLIADIVEDSKLISRLATLTGTLPLIIKAAPTQLDQVQVPMIISTNGVQAMANAAEVLIRSELSCPSGICTPTASLAYRDGRRHICWNDGTCFDGTTTPSTQYWTTQHQLCLNASGTCYDGTGTPTAFPRRYPSPLYMLLDALHSADDAWAANMEAPSRHDAWLSARGQIVDQLLTVDLSVPSAPKFANGHARSIVFSLLRFLNEQIGAHLGAGNGTAWANSFTTDATDMVASPLAGALLALMDDLYLNTSARPTFTALLRYLLSESSPNEGFDSNLLAVIDALYLLEDEASTVPLLHALAPFFATNATTVVASGGTVDTTGSLVDSTVTVLNEVDNRDMTHAVSAVLAASVTLPATGDPEAPLETIGDVIAEVNREAPNAGTPLTAADWALLLASVRDFALAENNGLERLYAVIQNRRLP